MDKTHDEHLDPLVAEALSGHEPPAELIDRICELTDGKLNEALDRAIGPQTVACDHDVLVQRILTATSERPAVIGRVGMSAMGLAWRVAAVIAVAAGAYLIFAAFSEENLQTAPSMASRATTTQSTAIDELELELESLAVSTDSAFDRKVALVSAGVEQIGADAVWAESPDVLVDRAAETVDWYQSDADSSPAWF